MKHKGFLPPLNGLVLLDKPKGVTSNAVLMEAKHRLGQEKAGHGGTLDPLATGVLPIFFGSWTKLSHYCLTETKEYRAIVRLGVKTDTGDSEGKQIADASVPLIHADNLGEIQKQFVGTLEQIPPAFSAIKVQGQASYKRAAKARVSGVVMKELPPRFVEIYQLTLRLLDEKHLDIKVKASKGMYVRTLAEQIAQALGTYGHLVALRRIAVGRFHVHMAVSLKELRADGKGWVEVEALLPNLPKANISYDQQDMIAQGRSVPVQLLPVVAENCGTIVALSPEGEVVALGSLDHHDDVSEGMQGIFRPKRVFVTA